MSLLDLVAVLLTLSALFGWVNRKLALLPHTIGLLVMGVAASLVLLGIDALVPGHHAAGLVRGVLGRIDFSAVVMDGMLAFLIFAGALSVDVEELRRRAGPVTALSILGTALSTAIVGTGLWGLSLGLGRPLPLEWALVFGALISPTDPVAVMSTLKSVDLPESLKVQIEGEALFNDGIGIVLFTVLLRFASGASPGETSPGAVALLLAREAGGGLALGAVTGYLAYRAMRAIDDYPVEVLVTLALVTATYALAERLGTSGPLAIVAAGLIIGDRGPRYAMSETTRRYVFGLWSLIDEVLNSVLFLLIGLEVTQLAVAGTDLLLALAAIPLVLGARAVAVAIWPALFRGWRDHLPASSVPLLVWAGVRGGISIALSLSLPDGPAKPVLLTATYAVVLFSIAVQGASLGALARRTVKP